MAIDTVESWLKRKEFLSWGAQTPTWFAYRFDEAIDRIVEQRGKPLVIGICGNAGTGKDSALNALFNSDLFKDVRANGRVRRFAFADPLREIGKAVGFTMEQMTDRTLKETTDEFWGISPRKFLQMAGTEMFRNVWRDDVWVQIGKRKILDFYHDKVGDPKIQFITDVRFPNEAQMIHDVGGIIVRVTRDGFTKTGANLHESERLIAELPADIEIVNDVPNADIWAFKFLHDIVTHFMHNAFYY